MNNIMIAVDIAAGIVLGVGILSFVGFKLMSTDWFINWSIEVACKITAKSVELGDKLDELFTKN